MSGRLIVYAGAHSSHGGIVISSTSSNTLVEAGGQRPVSLLGDYHVCPRKHHGITPVLSSGFATFNALPMTVLGDFCSCGAVIVDSCINSYTD